MFAALLVLMAAVIGGAVATYLFDDRSRVAYRLAVGVCLGMTALGLVGYVAATWMGMGGLSVALATAVTLAVPLRLVRGGAGRLGQALRAEITRPWTMRTIARAVAAVLLLGLLAVCYRRAMDVRDEGIYTSYVDNYADLTLHIGIITGFVYGENYPPEHPEYAGTRLAYPFVVDFVAAMLVQAGASVQGAMFVQNMLLTAALLVILYVWGRRLTGDPLAGALTALIVMLSGGFGFVMMFGEIGADPEGVWHYLTHLPHDFTAYEQRFRWANALVYWFVPMRSMLLGVPLFLVVTGLWWRALGHEPQEPARPELRPSAAAKKKEKGKKAVATAPMAAGPAEPTLVYGPERTMIAAGAIAGFMLLVHAHTCVVLGVMGLLLMFITRRWRLWIAFGAVAGVLVLPQGLWAISGASVKGETFYGVHPGWSGRDESVALARAWVPDVTVETWRDAVSVSGAKFSAVFALGVARYWLLNTGLLIPLLVAALLWRGRRPVVPRPLLIFYAPFVLCFVVPNVWKFAPWEWDNIKVMIYWFIPSVPLVALLLTRLWRSRPADKAAAVLCTLGLTLSGGLDIGRVLTGTLDWRVFGNEEIAMGELIREMTPPRAVMLNAPMHNHPFMLSGRRSFFGYPGTLWTHGISGEIYGERERVVKRIYAGEADAVALIEQYKIDYAVVGPMERENMKPLNEEFFKRFEVVGRAGAGILYKLR